MKRVDGRSIKQPFFQRYAFALLLIIFFLVPFSMRGARMAVQRMKNDVKDWLPSDFSETTDLDWFRDHFLGEQFAVVSWENCTGKDESFISLVDRFFPEVPPSIQKTRELLNDDGDDDISIYPNWRDDFDHQSYMDPLSGLYTRQLAPDDLPPEDEFVGNRLGLHILIEEFYDWGGEKEKWLRGDDNRWYYVLPDGKLYRWKGGSSILQPVFNLSNRLLNNRRLTGELVEDLGALDGPWYYENPERLTARLFKSVTTGPGVLAQLTRKSGALEGDIDAARERLTGFLFGPDGIQTCLVVTLTDAAKRDLRRALGRGILGKPRGQLLVMAEHAGIEGPPPATLVPPFLSWMFPAPEVGPQSIKLGGPPIDNVAIDEEGQITLVRLVGLSLLVGLTLSWLSFRSVNITLMVFFVGGISAVTSLSFVYWSDSSVDAVLMSMPSLVYVLGLSGAVHIVNYYRDAVQEHGLNGAPEAALSAGWKPCLLAAVTTALGLISLYASNILPIRKFGLFSAIGVMATLILLFTYLPSALQHWPPRRFKYSRQQSTAERIVESSWMKICDFVIRNCRAVAIVCLLLMAIIGWGINNIQTDVQLLKMFDKNATIIRHYEWLEQNMGKLIPMEVVVKVDPALQRSTDLDSETDIFSLTFLERLEISKYIDEELKSEFGKNGRPAIGQTMLATTFAPELPSSSGGVLSDRRGYNSGLLNRKNEFLQSDFLKIDKSDGSELWRISMRLAALDNIDFGDFVSQLKQAIEPVIQAYRIRTAVMKKLVQDKGSIRGKRVMLVGLNSLNNKADDSAEINQTKIFVKRLFQLLRNAKLRIDHDLNYKSIEDLQAGIEQKDCIVLISDDHQLTDFLDESTVLDARDHIFDPTDDTTAASSSASADVSAVYTGLVPVVYKAQKTLLQSLIESTGWAFVMIALVMVVLLRSVRAGLLSMLPNVFPVVVIFGTMCWSGTLIDIGSMMTASVAMGIAVDDTVHFLTWFRRGLDSGLHRKDAIRLAYRKVATALTQTTAIGGLGLSVFAFSTFTPTQRFGTLMLALLAAALIGDLIFLPALLASPLGRVFDRKKKKKKKKKNSDASKSNSIAPKKKGRHPLRPHLNEKSKRRHPSPESEQW